MRNKKGLVLSILLWCFIIGVSIPLFMTKHTKVKADNTLIDLTGSTWLLNNYISPSTLTNTYNLTFTSNNNTYVKLSSNGAYRLFYWDSDSTNLRVYDGNGEGWENTNYKTIVISGGTSATDTNLINWLYNNGTLTGYTPPTPPGTEIMHKYWSPFGAMLINPNTEYRDNDIEYTIKFNEYNNSYEDTTQVGLIFKGKTTNDPRIYIESINGNGINLLYMDDNDNNYIENAMWLEFTLHDYMDTDLYNYMSIWGEWFDDGNAYLCGTNQGYVEGTEHGRALGQADGTQYTGLVTGIFNGLGGLLSIQVFPNITIGLLIGLPLLLGALVIILKILRG